MAHKQHTYKAGDRVRHEDFGNGTVKYVISERKDFAHAVEFDRSKIGFHDCLIFGGPHTKDGHGWWCEKHELTPIPSPRKRDASGRFAAAKKTAKKSVIARMKDRGITKRLEALERQVALNSAAIDVLKSANTLLECIERDKEKPQGLQRGDYTDASKEVADALTAMGWGWEDDDRSRCPYITTCGKGTMINTWKPYDDSLPKSEFLRRAEVTAKELGLIPKQVEKWVPKVGDWVVVTGPNCIGGTDLHPIGSTQKVDEVTGRVRLLCRYGGAWYDFSSLRTATPEEIAEATKPKPYQPKFGDVVEFLGREWKVVSEREDDDSDWLIYKNTDTGWNHDFAKASDLTLIRRP